MTRTRLLLGSMAVLGAILFISSLVSHSPGELEEPKRTQPTPLITASGEPERRFVFIIEIGHNRTEDTGVTITGSVDGSIFGPYFWTIGTWETLVTTKNPNPHLLLRGNQPVRGTLTCRIIDEETGEQIAFDTRTTMGAVRCLKDPLRGR